MRAFSSSAIVYGLLVGATAVPTPLAAQTTSTGAATFQNRFPDPLKYQPPVPEAPELEIVSVAEIALAGPLESGPRLSGGMIEIRTAGGLIQTGWTGSAAAPTPAPGLDSPATAPEPHWAVSADGKHRVKPTDPRLLVLQQVCADCALGWRQRWRLRVAGLAQVTPLITERRVYFGAADNQVYGVRRKNGHRAWVTPLDGPVLRPLALWVDRNETDVAALLAVPEPGAELVLLDARGGKTALRYRLQQEGDRIVGAPLATPDGYIVLARQDYSKTRPSLLVLEIALRAPKAPESDAVEPTGYNPPAPSGSM